MNDQKLSRDLIEIKLRTIQDDGCDDGADFLSESACSRITSRHPDAEAIGQELYETLKGLSYINPMAVAVEILQAALLDDDHDEQWEKAREWIRAYIHHNPDVIQ